MPELEDNLVNKWLVFGHHLGFDMEQLEKIRTHHPDNFLKCTTELLFSWWKHQEAPSWERVQQALRETEEKRVALDLEGKPHLKTDQVIPQSKI